MAVDAQMHLYGEEYYAITHFHPDDGRPDFSILRIKQADGGEMVFYSHDAFDSFVKEISTVWANGGVVVE